MNNEKLTLSIIFPTLNEGENLKFLIPEFINVLVQLEVETFEILIIDDGSTDDTQEVVSLFDSSSVKLIQRNSKPSLPMSIWDGIEDSNLNYVMWLDADGSMSANDAGVLIEKQKENLNAVIVGSRFVEGGGYKGTLLNQKNKLYNSLKNLRNSEDSFTAMYLSLIFNKFLSLISTNSVKDMTSGFIIGKKEYFSIIPFKKAFYGDYFVYLINELNHKNIEIIEVGYQCGLRMHGMSKTGSSLVGLVRLGRPYIKAALKSRRS